MVDTSQTCLGKGSEGELCFQSVWYCRVDFLLASGVDLADSKEKIVYVFLVSFLREDCANQCAIRCGLSHTIILIKGLQMRHINIMVG